MRVITSLTENQIDTLKEVLSNEIYTGEVYIQYNSIWFKGDIQPVDLLAARSIDYPQHHRNIMGVIRKGTRNQRGSYAA